jgi:hypothetical protein
LAGSVLERIRRTLVALRMPRALELLDHAVRQLERGEARPLELIDTRLAEELMVRETAASSDTRRYRFSDGLWYLLVLACCGGYFHENRSFRDDCRFRRSRPLAYHSPGSIYDLAEMTDAV